MASLIFNYGNMGSIKSAILICRAYKYKEIGMNPLILTSAKDTRSGLNKVKSRIDALEYKAISIKDSENIYEIINNVLESSEDKVDVVLCDEIQFFTPEQIDQLSDVVDFMDIPVYCYGLLNDFRTLSFAGSERLFNIADERIEVDSICSCGHKTNFNAKIVNGKIITEGKQIQIGGDESYVALCRKCYKLSKLNK